MSIQTEDTPAASPLRGMPGMGNTDPKAKTKSMVSGDGSIGDEAFRNGVIIVLSAWAVLFFLAYSLRHHNI